MTEGTAGTALFFSFLSSSFSLPRSDTATEERGINVGVFKPWDAEFVETRGNRSPPPFPSFLPAFELPHEQAKVVPFFFFFPLLHETRIGGASRAVPLLFFRGRVKLRYGT